MSAMSFRQRPVRIFESQSECIGDGFYDEATEGSAVTAFTSVFYAPMMSPLTTLQHHSKNEGISFVIYWR